MFNGSSGQTYVGYDNDGELAYRLISDTGPTSDYRTFSCSS